MSNVSKIFVITALFAIAIALFFGSPIYKNIFSGRKVVIATTTPVVVAKTEEAIITENTPDYTISVRYPVIPVTFEGADVANKYIKDLYTHRSEQFKYNLQMDTKNIPAGDLSGVQSSYATSYKVLATSTRYISILVQTDSYIRGMAHPMTSPDTFIFGIKEKKLVNVSDLFISGSSYLKTLSDLSLSDFKARKVEGDDYDVYQNLFKEGLEPNVANFSQVLPLQEGLLVYFSEYQVAPYAAGPQQVIIPYTKLKNIISKSGLLGDYIK